MQLSIPTVASRLLDWFLPRDCLGCGAEIGSSAEWCSDCRRQLEINPIIEVEDWQMIAPYRHAGPIRQAIHRLKYANRPDLARRLIFATFPADCSLSERGVTLVPVPLHPLRLVQRGYNQAALLAKAIGWRWHIPSALGLLSRRANTPPQVGQNREQRARNLRNAFIVRCSGRRIGNIWLVDDVVTTGSTAASCRDVLTAAGMSVGGIIAVSYANGSVPALPQVATGIELASWP